MWYSRKSPGVVWVAEDRGEADSNPSVESSRRHRSPLYYSSYRMPGRSWGMERGEPIEAWHDLLENPLFLVLTVMISFKWGRSAWIAHCEELVPSLPTVLFWAEPGPLREAGFGMCVMTSQVTQPGKLSQAPRLSLEKLKVGMWEIGPCGNKNDNASGKWTPGPVWCFSKERSSLPLRCVIAEGPAGPGSSWERRADLSKESSADS